MDKLKGGRTAATEALDLEEQKRLLQDAYENPETAVFHVDLRAMCGLMNGCSINTCFAHSIQVLLKEVVRLFAIMSAINTRVGDLAMCVTGRAEVRNRVKRATGVTLLIPCATRWSYFVRSAERLVEVSHPTV